MTELLSAIDLMIMTTDLEELDCSQMSLSKSTPCCSKATCRLLEKLLQKPVGPSQTRYGALIPIPPSHGYSSPVTHTTHDSQPQVLVLSGEFFMKKGLIAFAEHEFRRALRLEPNLLDGYLGLGSALAQYAPPKNSLAMFEKAAKLA